MLAILEKISTYLMHQNLCRPHVLKYAPWKDHLHITQSMTLNVSEPLKLRDM
jgi:hypothetical protein